MDKKMLMIAGGSFTLGGLMIGVMAGMHGRYGNNDCFEGMMGNQNNE